MSFPKAGKFRKLGEAYAARSAEILGEVTLGTDTSIWFGSVVRADDAPVTIGNRTNIQDLSVLHPEPGDPLVIGQDVTVGHRAMIHCRKISDRCLIGMGSILLGWSEIGEESIIAAGALVREKMVIPPRSLVVGVPGKIVRQVTDAEVKEILRSTEDYVKKVAQYLEE